MGWSVRRPCFRCPSDQGPFTDPGCIRGRSVPWASGTGVVPGHAPAIGHIGTGRGEHAHAQRGQRMARSSASFTRRHSGIRIRLNLPSAGRRTAVVAESLSEKRNRHRLFIRHSAIAEWVFAIRAQDPARMHSRRANGRFRVAYTNQNHTYAEGDGAFAGAH